MVLGLRSSRRGGRYLLSPCLLCPREYRPKENVTFLENGTRVAAYQCKTFVFLPERSVGDPDIDMITTINIPAVVSKSVCVCVYTVMSSYFSLLKPTIMLSVVYVEV